MMTSLRNSPLSKHSRSSVVTVMAPLDGGGGNWINLRFKQQVNKISTGIRFKQTFLLPILSSALLNTQTFGIYGFKLF